MVVARHKRRRREEKCLFHGGKERGRAREGDQKLEERERERERRKRDRESETGSIIGTEKTPFPLVCAGRLFPFFPFSVSYSSTHPPAGHLMFCLSVGFTLYIPYPHPPTQIH